MNKFYRCLYKLLAGIIRRIYRVEVVGAENEPESGSFVVCANHISNHDVVILAASMKHQIRYLAKAELFKVPLLKQLITALGAYPIKRGAGDVGAIKKTVELVKNGEVVGLFLQGHRYPKVHPSETKPLPGIGLVAVKSESMILPVTIIAKNYKIRFFRKTKIVIGKPIPFESHLPLENNKSDYDRIANTVFEKICENAETDPFKKKEKRK